MKDRKLRNQFPRTDDVPGQSAKYWAKEKDRYLRQLLISDIEAETGRELIVYFSRLDQMITETDADDLCEILSGTDSKDIDILIHTPGGVVDAVEKFISVIRLLNINFRAIIPSLAKSGGTLIALSSNEIMMGVNSELGPVDSQMNTSEYRSVSAELVAADSLQPSILPSIAKMNVERGKGLAEKYLRIMLACKDNSPTPEQILHAEGRVANAMAKLSSPAGYGSHGAVIDYNEAKSLGLPVLWLSNEATLWKKIWMLYCIYDADTKNDNLGKIFEGAVYSISRPPLVWD